MRMMTVFACGLAATAQAQEWAKAKLEASPRHGEWVKLKVGNREVKSFVVFPEVKGKATAVVVIHEIFGLTDWVRLTGDELAAAGYIAICPDLLSGAGPGGGDTDSFKGDDVRKAIMNLKPDQVTADLNAAYDHVAALDSCNGKIAVAGFCWGGGQAFRYATNNAKLKAAFPFYGSAPTDPAALARIACPVHGFYAENDNRINAGIPKAEELMKAAGKTYEPVKYAGAGHGFLRAGAAPDAQAANKQGREDAWKRWKTLLAKL